MIQKRRCLDDLNGDNLGKLPAKSKGASKILTQRRSKRSPIRKEGIASANEIVSGRNVKNVSTLMMLNSNIKKKNNFKTQREVGGK